MTTNSHQAIIEISKGSAYKYEIDKFDDKRLILDRVLPIDIPFSYGYFSNTIAPDSDSLDVFVLSDQPLVPLSEVNVEIIGVFKCLDQGVRDDKVLAILKDDYWRYNATDIKQIEHYLKNYKKGFEVLTNAYEAVNVEAGMEVYNQCKR